MLSCIGMLLPRAVSRYHIGMGMSATALPVGFVWTSNRSCHRARKNGLGGINTADDLYALFERQDGRCAMCRRGIHLGKGHFHLPNRKPKLIAHLDHIVPQDLWAAQAQKVAHRWNDLPNLQWLCGHCNSSKGQNSPHLRTIQLGSVKAAAISREKLAAIFAVACIRALRPRRCAKCGELLVPKRKKFCSLRCSYRHKAHHREMAAKAVITPEGRKRISQAVRSAWEKRKQGVSL